MTSRSGGLLDEHGDIATAVVETGGGGLHYWFRVPDGVEVRNSAGKLGPGLDVRGDGGYVIVPPSLHASGKRYAWRNESNANGIAPAPEWLLELVRKPKRPSPPAMPIRELVDCDGTLYGVAALEAETERVRAAPQGQRNHTLNKAAFALGQLEAGRELASGVAEDELRSAALGAGLPEWEIERTLASGLNAGREKPRRATETDGVSALGVQHSETTYKPMTHTTPSMAEADANPMDLVELDTKIELGRVDGAGLLDDISRFINRYVVLPRPRPDRDVIGDLLALWVLHTHTFQASWATPYLRITSAAPESGKTVLLEVLASICRAGWHAVNPSVAVLYRKVDQDPPTLLLDEMDNYNLSRPEGRARCSKCRATSVAPWFRGAPRRANFGISAASVPRRMRGSTTEHLCRRCSPARSRSGWMRSDVRIMWDSGSHRLSTMRPQSFAPAARRGQRSTSTA